MIRIPLFWHKEWALSNYGLFLSIVLRNNREFLVGCEKRDHETQIPGRLTFGGFFPLDEGNVSEQESTELITTLIKQLPERNKIIWKMPPSYFFPQIFDSQIYVIDSMHNHKTLDQNQHINIPDWKHKSMSKGNQKKVRQLMKLDVSYKTATLREVDTCYRILEENRNTKGVNVSMSQNEIEKCLLVWPDIYKLVYLEKEKEVLAVAFTVDLAPTIRYVLYWADNIYYRNYSPVAYLCTKIIDEAARNKIAFLDLGISSHLGVVNEGLFRFKANLGAERSIKPTFEVKLSSQNA